MVMIKVFIVVVVEYMGGGRAECTGGLCIYVLDWCSKKRVNMRPIFVWLSSFLAVVAIQNMLACAGEYDKLQ